jgi:methylphosphotriester-DNA--protein-cysteine methyltransferase
VEPSAWYRPVEPPDVLRGVLACSWTAVPDGEHRLTPDGCSDLLHIDNGVFVLCGPERESWTFSLPSGTTAVGVRFRPGALPAVFDLDVSTIADQRVPVAEVIGQDAARAISEAVAATAGLDAQRQVLVDHIGRLIGDASLAPETEAILDVLAASPRATQQQLATTTGMSVRSLRRHALRHFGYGTATLSRILRFQRFLAVASLATGERSLAVFAAQAGYVDQAHLARDCRAITSRSTTEFLAEYFPTFPDMADPYKTPSASWATLAS